MEKSRKYQREEFILSYGGPAVRNHEMDVEVLAESLLSFKSLAERTNAALNGKSVSVSVKVKGSFQQGSLTAQMVVEYVGMALPVIPQVVQTIRELVELKIFLKGRPPKAVDKAGDGSMNITNSEGSTQIFHGPVYNISGNATIVSDLGKVVRPLDKGVDEVKFIVPGKDDEPPQVTIATKKEKEALIPSVDDFVEENTRRCELEVLTPNTDGEPRSWRFYDPENGVTFQATVADAEFLQRVALGKYTFRHGDMVTVDMRTIKKTITQRKRTERIIMDVLDYTRPELEDGE